MRPSIYWIGLPTSERLAIMPRPRAGDWLEEEISGWRCDGVDIVVSLLEREEVDELGLSGEADICRANGIEFRSFPIADRAVPASVSETLRVVQVLGMAIRDGKAVAMHCRAGIGRSGLVAASILVWAGFEPDAAFDLISKARGVLVPDTDEQRRWVLHFKAFLADSL